MMQNQGAFRLFFFVLGLCSLYSVQSVAEVWDLGYSNPTEVEAIPGSIEDESTLQPEELADGELQTQNPQVTPPRKVENKTAESTRKSSSSFSQISTAKNTYGVVTVEDPSMKIFVSPYAGIASIFGNETVNVSPQYAMGGRLGLLITDKLMIEGGYQYSLINTSAPITLSLGYQPDNVFEFKRKVVDAGVKFFFLGRESRLRPFVGGSLGYGSSAFNYTSGYRLFMASAEDIQIRQFLGTGQLGAEFAISKSIVATASFMMNGIFSSKIQSSLNAATSSGLEASRIQAGNSLSQSMVYTGTLGLGVYF